MNKILIYGGNSLISLEIIKILYEKTDGFIVFCRKANEFKKKILELNYNQNKFDIKEVDLENLKENIKIIDTISVIQGIYWVAGYNGDALKEMEDMQSCEINININFLHPVLLINRLVKKLDIKNNSSFISVITSVAGLRGRAKNIFYGSSKSALISYLSGLRQKYNNEINVITVIPGYISTKNFNISAPSILVSTPKSLAKKMVDAVRKKKEIVYSNIWWKIIMIIINLIPEKIFKKLKF
tara:strand:- start:968 stop:1690 length:723 start_codon:yes stop_codon:yes gene_type:complete